MSEPQMQCRVEKVATIQVGKIKTEWVPWLSPLPDEPMIDFNSMFDGVKVPGLNHDEVLAKAAALVGEYIAQKFEDAVTGTIEGEVVE